MSNPLFSAYLTNGEQCSGELLQMNRTAGTIDYLSHSEKGIEQLPLSSVSHLYHTTPHSHSSAFPFTVNFSSGQHLDGRADGYQKSNWGEDLFHINGSDIHLLIPRQSGHKIHHHASSNRGDQTIHLVDQMLQEAIAEQASDIHLRPLQSVVEVRYRIDGEMRLTHRIERAHYPAVVSRIKILGNMDIAEHRLPQDGAHHLNLQDRKIDLRISTVPVLEGESVVIRILDPQAGLIDLSEIGFQSNDEQQFRQLLQKKSGLILVTGPTGSGKSTTLYAAMQALRGNDLNIISLEDPVEYRMEHIRQIDINDAANNTFAKNLRHVLRHDPDVILIGEIRDEETAHIALQSAYTGHLVLSTLHTGNAPSAISRLLEMGIEPYTLKDTLLGVLSQRLVRKQCPECHADATLQPHCDHCRQSGYRGRVPLYELMVVDSPIREQIVDGVTVEQIQRQAIASGMVPMEEYAATLAQQGVIAP